MKNVIGTVLLITAVVLSMQQGPDEEMGKVELALRTYPQLMSHDVFGACHAALVSGEIGTATEEAEFLEKAAEQAYLTAMEYIARADHEAYLGPDGAYEWTVEKAIAHRADCQRQAERVR